MIEEFLSEVDAYCRATGLKPSTLATYAAGNSKLFKRMEANGQCLPRTMQKVRAYMAAHPPQTAPHEAA